jgi:hypothetical protein
MNENASTVHSLLNEISSNLSQRSSSRKDEVRIMQAMLSDPSYEVSIYGKDGIEGTYNPAEDFRDMCASVISNAAKVPMAEATQLMSNYSVRKSEASSMVNISKEFVNTFLKTGRKLPLGAREKSDISLSAKNVEASTRLYPQKIGVNDDGSDRYSKTATTVPAHESIRVHAPCPSWVK